ncbi:hypothetical protein [Mycolicibacterium sarraceniae]|uniref:Uncharacterized protein n=1 Tax=Mycolicibacterium sarraceniae TaxID=1534348 RepID=A0A7I7SY77_9MYCO|nr:hypothetical protein [Mycolicibacterium sarraceniae]BBY61580.1 hypothetical protein MSAR_47160 [Mycolicibacterium sarraceniae]
MLLEEPYPASAGALTARAEPTYITHTAVPLSRRFPRKTTGQGFHPNDAAQARLFGELMQAEIEDLEDLIAVAERRWSNRLDAGWGAERTPEPVLRLRERLKEAQRLQKSLQARFGAY